MRQVVFGGLSATIGHIRANKLRPLAVTTERFNQCLLARQTGRDPVADHRKRCGLGGVAEAA
jgi:hypothetical protein